MSRHRVSPSPFLSSSSHTTQFHYTNSYTYSHPNLNFLQYTLQILVPHVMWSAQVVRDLKIDHTQHHLSTCMEPKVRNSAVGWQWNTHIHIGETCHSLSDHNNGHRFTTKVLNPNLPVPSTLNPTRSVFRIAGLLVLYVSFLIPHLTTFASILKLHTNSSTNHIMPWFKHPLKPLLYFHLHT